MAAASRNLARPAAAMAMAAASRTPARPAAARLVRLWSSGAKVFGEEEKAAGIDYSKGYSEETLRQETIRVYAEFEQNMKEIQQQRDEFWRREMEHWARLQKEIDTLQRVSDVFPIFCVSAVALKLASM